MRLTARHCFHSLIALSLCTQLLACGDDDDDDHVGDHDGGSAGSAGKSGSGGSGKAGTGSGDKDASMGETDAGDAGSMSDSGQYVFISASEDDSVRVYDLTPELTFVKKVSVCKAPAEVRSFKDGKHVSVLCRGATDDDPGEVDFIDTASLTVTHMVAVGKRPTHSYVGPDGSTLFVGNDKGDSVSIIDTTTWKGTEVPTGVGHHKVALATDGKGGDLTTLYVSNITDQTITALDGKTHDVLAQIDVGPSPHGMDYSFVSKRVYNCSGDDMNDVEVIATDGSDANTIVARIPLDGSRCGHLEVSADGKYAYASMNGADKLARIDVSDNSVTYYDAGMGPDWFAEAEGAIWVVDNRAWSVTYVNQKTGADATLETGPTGTDDDGGMLSPNGGHIGLAHAGPWVFVANGPLDTVSVIRADHMHVHATLENIPGASNAAVGGVEGGFPYPR